MNKELFEYLNESVQEMVDHAAGKTFLPTTVYKLDSTGRKRMWRIWVDGDENKGIINILSGLVDGDKVPQTIEITEGKNAGKANATNPYTQAIAEAKAKLKLQLRSGYVENEADVKASGTLGSGLPQCMLAHKYSKDGSQKSSKTLDKMKIKGEKIYISRKLDGIRGLIVTTENDAVLFTRKGDKSKVQAQHILDDALKARQTHFPGLEGQLILDGELYVDPSQMSFTDLNGHLNRKDSQDLKEIGKIRYHIYDVMVDKPYPERYDFIKKFVSSSIDLVESYEITANDEVIEEYLDKFIAEGYEGAMLRTLNSPYENKRTWSLCKVKVFESEELELVGMEQDVRGGGLIGAFVMKLNQPTKDRDGNIVTTVKAGVTGLTQEQQKNIWNNQDRYIGTMCTIEYFGKSSYNIHRFPKMKQLNRVDV